MLDGERGVPEDNYRDSVMTIGKRTSKNGGTKGPLKTERKLEDAENCLLLLT